MTEQEADKNYDELRREFANWLMDPFRGTQRQWAEDHGVTEFTVSRWKADPEFVRLLDGWRGRAKIAIPAMLQAVIARVISTGDPHAYRAVMETLGESKMEVDLNLSGPFMELQKRLVEIRRQSIEAEQPRVN